MHEELSTKPSTPNEVSLTLIADENRVDMCPCVVELPDGNILCVYDSFKKRLNFDSLAYHMGYKISPDKGKSWGQRQSFESKIPDTSANNRANIYMTSWGTIFLTWLNFPPRERLTRVSLYCSTSIDGYSWSSTREIIPTGGTSGISDRTHGLVELSNGNLVIPFSWWKGKPGPGGEPGSRYHVARAMISTDRGKTWHRGEDVDVGDFGVVINKELGRRDEWHRGLIEPSIVELSDSRLLMIMRGQNKTGAFYKSYSSNGGETWSVPVPEPQLRGARQGNYLHKLKSGNIVYVWNNNLSGAEFRDRTPLSIAISTDDGKTWRGYREIANYPNILYDNTHPGLACTVGYVTQLSDGTIGVAFNTGRCWHESEISFARFAEEWLLEKGFFDDFEHGLREWRIGRDDITVSSEIKKSGNFALKINDISRDYPTEVIHNIPLIVKGRMNFWVFLDNLNNGFGFNLGDGYAEINSGYWTKARFSFFIEPDGSLKWRDGSDGNLKELPVATDLPLKVWINIELNWDVDSDKIVVFVNGNSKGIVGRYKEGIGICYIQFSSGSVSGIGDRVFIDDVSISG